MHTLEILLKEFATKLGINDFCFDEDKFCTLHIDEETISRHWKQTTNTLLVYSVIYKCNEGEGYKPLVLRILLEANLFGGDGLGMNIGLHESSHAFVLSYNIPVESLNMQEFEALLGRITEKSAFWRRRLESVSQDEGKLLATDDNSMMRC